MNEKKGLLRVGTFVCGLHGVCGSAKKGLLQITTAMRSHDSGFRYEEGLV